jgi:hypothetical protein
MPEGNVQLTRDNLIIFLDFAGEKGLLKKTTAKARKDASKIVLRILDDNEASDLSKVDLESVIQRHRNLATGKIMPKTLATYESRTRIAVRDFLEYVKGPSTWAASQQRTRKTSKVTPPKKSKNASPIRKSDEFEKHEEIPRRPSVHIDLQIHISPEATPEQIDEIFASISRHLPWK